MSGSNKISLAAKLSGLALCTFMTACGQSNTETISQDKDSPKQAKTINQEFIDLAAKSTLSEQDCHFMRTVKRTPFIEDDKSPAMEKAKISFLNRCMG